MQEWRYKNAVRVSAEDAARYGLQDGALVLESTLAGTPGSSQDTLVGPGPTPTEEAAVRTTCCMCQTCCQLCCHIPAAMLMICCDCNA